MNTIKNSNSPAAPNITVRRSESGAMEVLVDDWVYVTVNYDYRYTNNASTRLLAEGIQKLLRHALFYNPQ